MAVLALGSAAKEQAFYADVALTTTTSGSETTQSERPASAAARTLPVDDALSHQRDDVIRDADGEHVLSAAVAGCNSCTTSHTPLVFHLLGAMNSFSERERELL